MRGRIPRFPTGALPRPSARLRLTGTFALLSTAVGAVIIASVYVAMRFVPDYRLFRASIDSPGPASSTEPGSVSGFATAEATSAAISPEATSGAAAELVVTGPADVLRLLLTSSVVAFGVVLVVSIIVSWIVAGRVLRPIDKIAAAARGAAAGTLDHRIELGGPHDEFRRLADTFDAMLDRLQTSFESQRRFAANASHELKTPLATTQALLDVALLDPETFDRARLTTRLRETNTRNVRIVESLLALSEAQSGARAHDPVAVDEVVREVLATSSVDIAERSLDVTVDLRPVELVGDAMLLRLLVSNLVSNAVHYGEPRGLLAVTFRGGTLTVENSGAVLADDAVGRLTEPFYRAAGRVAGSHGLGLALVSAIADAHGADLRLRARPSGGLVVTVTFAAG